MKFKRWSQSILAATGLIGASAGLVSCGTSNTVDYLYATSSRNNPGQINVYRVDSQSGALTQIPDSPYPTQGRNPVSLVIDSGGKNLYVANRDDNSIVQFGIGTDAKLYGAHTINPSGSEPVSLSIHSYTANNTTANFLFVVENLQPNFTDLNTGPGALYVYKLASDGTLGSTPVTQMVNGTAQAFYPLGNTPTGVNVTDDGQHVYVTDILATGQTGTDVVASGVNGTGCTAGQGAVQGFNLSQHDSNGVPTGVLTPAAGSPFCAGVTPSAIASHPYSTFLYVTDSAQNQVIEYSINTTTSPGSLRTLPQSVVATGTTPAGIVVEPRGMFVYVSNRIGGSVSGYAVNLGTGALTTLATAGSAATQTQPICLIVEPALARFLYTANFVDGSISGFSLDPNSGALAATQGAFYGTAGLSTCVAATSHGNHPIIHVQNTAG